MALIVEDGTGMEDSQAYISVADTQSYFELYGVPEAWADADITQQEVALRNATRWLDNAVRWPSTPLNADQALAWPREPFFDTAGNYVEGIPRGIREANAELAGMQLEGSLFSYSDASVTQESWGDSSVTYAGYKSSEFQSRLDYIMKLLGRYGSNSVNVIETFRA